VLALLLAGMALGALPMIIYNIQAPLQDNSLLTAIGIFGGATVHSPILDQLVHGPLGVLLIGLPSVIGNNDACSQVSQVLFLGGHGPGALQCTLEQGTWSLVWIALWIASFRLCLRGIRALPRKSEPRTPEQQYTLVRLYGRLGLLVAAVLSLCLFALSSSSSTSPFLSSRYIVYLWIATPALIYPLWRGANLARAASGGMARFIIINFTRLALLAIALLLLLGTVKTFQEIPGTRATNAQQEDFVQNLTRIGIYHIYSDYWTCERVMFQSAGRITCYTVNETLDQGYERYLPNKAIVTADAGSSWAFPTDLPQATAIAQRMAQSGKPYHRYEFDGYVVYQPG
jgi:hypothetical protein